MIEASFIEITLMMILVMVVSWVTCLSAVLLGGTLVFKTKRESFDTLFPRREREKTAINLDEADYSAHSADNIAVADKSDPMQEVFKKFDEENIAFLKQMYQERNKPQPIEEEATDAKV